MLGLSSSLINLRRQSSDQSLVRGDERGSRPQRTALKSLSSLLGPAVMGEGPRPDPAPLSPPSSDCHLPWKAGMGSPPPCVSVEATKIIPVDLQEAWNQSISSLESISSPPAPPEPVHPRVGALSKVAGARPASYTPPWSTSSTGVQVSGDSSSLPEKKTKKTEAKEEEEEEEAQEVQPLMPSGAGAPPPPPSSPPTSGRLRNPRVYLRSLVTAPPAEHRSRGPTNL